MIDRQPSTEGTDVNAAAQRGSGWEMGWTKHGTPCMTRAIPILNRPAATAESFEQHGAGGDFAPDTRNHN